VRKQGRAHKAAQVTCRGIYRRAFSVGSRKTASVERSCTNQVLIDREAKYPARVAEEKVIHTNECTEEV